MLAAYLSIPFPFSDICFGLDSRYVHNNIFFSFAVDADLEQLSRKQAADATNKIESSGMLYSSSEKTSNHLPHETHSVPDKSDGCNTEILDAVADIVSDVPSEAQLSESEQATYASANNDLKGTKAYQEADIPGLYNLAMAIIDYRGHRVIAQVAHEFLSNIVLECLISLY